jgi:PAS domain S-box-containing protein
MESLFRQIVEAAPNAMLMIDVAGRIQMVNAQAERIFGYPRNEMLEQPIEILVPHGSRDRHPTWHAAFFADPQIRPMGVGRELHARRADGVEFPVEISLNPIETDDDPMVLCAVVDISHRKQEAERVLAALREKEILLGEIHHRVKNNLQIVCSLLELQWARVTDPTALSLLRDSQNRIRSMALIHQTLYGSKDFARVDFAAFLDSLLPVVTEAYGTRSRHISIRVDVEPVRFPINTAMPCGLIVNELITNAFKHAFAGRDQGEIRVALTRQLGDEVLLSVSDDGVGLPDDADPEQTGTLGLQLVRLLTNQLAGDLSINRANPTRFSVRFQIR